MNRTIEEQRKNFIYWIIQNQTVNYAFKYGEVLDLFHLYAYLYDLTNDIQDSIFSIQDFEEMQQYYLEMDPQSETDLIRIIKYKESVHYSAEIKDTFPNNYGMIGSAIRSYLRFLYFEEYPNMKFIGRENHINNKFDLFFVSNLKLTDEDKFIEKKADLFLKYPSDSNHPEQKDTLYIITKSNYLLKGKVTDIFDNKEVGKKTIQLTISHAIHLNTSRAKDFRDNSGVLDIYNENDLHTLYQIESVISLYSDQLNNSLSGEVLSKKNKQEFITKIDNLKSEYSERRKSNRNYCQFEGVWHFTDYSNLKSIFERGSILSRNSAKSLESFLDGADKSVIKRADFALDCTRFYYRPQTPTLFNNEGVKIKEYLNLSNGETKDVGINHLPKPVYMSFDESIIYDIHSIYSDGNMSSNATSHGKTLDFFQDIQWDDVFYNDFSDREQRRIRQAELLYVGNLPLKKYLKKIYFRSETDLKQARTQFKDTEFVSYFTLEDENNLLFSNVNDKAKAGELYENNYIENYTLNKNKELWLLFKRPVNPDKYIIRLRLYYNDETKDVIRDLEIDQEMNIDLKNYVKEAHVKAEITLNGCSMFSIEL